MEGFYENPSVKDPLIRENNKPIIHLAVIHYKIVECLQVKIKVAPKGFPVMRIEPCFMLKPADGNRRCQRSGPTAVKEAGPECMSTDGSGVETGGTFENALMAKRH